MPDLARIDVHPIKALPSHAVADATVLSGGALAWDRRYAIVDADGEYVNAKREAALHRIATDFDREGGTVAVGERGSGDRERFHLDDDRGALGTWLSEFLGSEVDLIRDDDGIPDRTDLGGPTVVATGTLERVGDWFDLDPANVRRRFRANLLVDAPAFWEDRLYAGQEEVRRFDVGDVTFEGVKPCARCVVPTRDPDTGEAVPEDFRERFVERRRETLPEFADESWYDHHFRLCPVTRLAAAERGGGRDGDAAAGAVGDLAVGDRIDLGEVRPR